MSASPITRLIRPKEKDLGGFSVRRLLPHGNQPMVGPWIFFDHAGPSSFAPGDGVDVRPHPHINLATVTYLFDGELMHRDSVGSAQLIRPGDINLMVSGSGIVHSERTPEATRAQGHTLHALQLWLALPEAEEETDPAFYHYPADTISTVQVEGVAVRVMMGQAYGVTSPVKTFAETLYVEAELRAGQSLTLPEAAERAVYVAAGHIMLGKDAIPTYHMGILAQGTVTLQTTENTRLAIIGGEALGQRHIDWNFVSSRPERIQQARDDWKAGRFPRVPGDEAEFIPLPE